MTQMSIDLTQDVVPRTASDVSAARGVLELLLGPPNERVCAVRYWDGSEDGVADGARAFFTMVFRSAGAVRRMLTPPTELRMAEAYMRGDFDIEGDMERATAMGDDIRKRLARPGALARLVRHVVALPHDDAAERARRRRDHLGLLGRRHSRARDRAAVRSHYDVGNDFYALWLDQRMVYSCAYFPTGQEDINAAQEAKLDLLCRKLRLSAGERLLDIGCGWGGLVRFAALRYGVNALGITLSERQADLANARIRAEGLSDRCRVEVRDYRDFPPGTEFDKVVSVGMFEHVGRTRLPTYFHEAARLTKPGGLFLNHGIVRSLGSGPMLQYLTRRALWREGAFVSRYVFPDGELVPLDVAVRSAERAGLEVRDVETLREHYVLTLRHWVRRLESARAQAEALVGAQTWRVWRLYMAASAHAFESGKISLAQVLLARPDAQGRVGVPRTRADIYAPARDAAKPGDPATAATSRDAAA